MIKSTLTGQDPDTSNIEKYPRLKRHKQNKFVVLFKNENEGMVVWSEMAAFNVGFEFRFGIDIISENFEDLPSNQVVTLKNI